MVKRQPVVVEVGGNLPPVPPRCENDDPPALLPQRLQRRPDAGERIAEVVGEKCREAQQKGYRYVKLHETREPEVAIARETLGDGVPLMVDTNCPWTPTQALENARLLKPYDLYWLEEPIFPPEDFNALAWLQSESGVRVAAGENACTAVEFDKMFRSANHLAEHFEGYPLLLFAFCQHDPTGGSIFPAVWNAMLAARAEGVGSAITSVFMLKGDAMREILGVPDESWNFACCVTMGYPTGRWGVAPRRPVHEVAFRNGWDGDLGFEIPEPLWPTGPAD